jgi:hypothetical protein
MTIPGSEIKFYTEASGGTQVTSGASGNTVIYPRVVNTSYSLLPFTGRLDATGTKTFTRGADSDVATIRIPGKGAMFFDSDFDMSLPQYDGVDGSALTKDASSTEKTWIYNCPASYDEFFILIDINLNFASLDLVISGPYTALNTTFTLNGNSISPGTNIVPSGDPGAEYAMTLEIEFYCSPLGIDDVVEIQICDHTTSTIYRHIKFNHNV